MESLGFLVNTTLTLMEKTQRKHAPIYYSMQRDEKSHFEKGKITIYISPASLSYSRTQVDYSLEIVGRLGGKECPVHDVARWKSKSGKYAFASMGRNSNQISKRLMAEHAARLSGHWAVRE